MPHHGKAGTRQVSLNIDPRVREEILRLTGEKTLTEATHQALAIYEIDVAPSSDSADGTFGIAREANDHSL